MNAVTRPSTADKHGGTEAPASAPVDDVASTPSASAVAAVSPRSAGVLLAATPARWYEVACERWRELLVDHANCEKKAASTALSLIFSYPEDMALTDKMSRLAREELRHFEQVQKLMQELGVPFSRMQPSRYAEGLSEGDQSLRAGAIAGSDVVWRADRSAFLRAIRRPRPAALRAAARLLLGLAVSEAGIKACICGSPNSAPATSIGARA